MFESSLGTSAQDVEHPPPSRYQSALPPLPSVLCSEQAFAPSESPAPTASARFTLGAAKLPACCYPRQELVRLWVTRGLPRVRTRLPCPTRPQRWPTISAGAFWEHEHAAGKLSTTPLLPQSLGGAHAAPLDTAKQKAGNPWVTGLTCPLFTGRVTVTRPRNPWVTRRAAPPRKLPPRAASACGPPRRNRSRTGCGTRPCALLP